MFGSPSWWSEWATLTPFLRWNRGVHIDVLRQTVNVSDTFETHCSTHLHMQLHAQIGSNGVGKEKTGGHLGIFICLYIYLCIYIYIYTSCNRFDCASLLGWALLPAWKYLRASGRRVYINQGRKLAQERLHPKEVHNLILTVFQEDLHLHMRTHVFKNTFCSGKDMERRVNLPAFSSSIGQYSWIGWVDSHHNLQIFLQQNNAELAMACSRCRQCLDSLRLDSAPTTELSDTASRGQVQRVVM